MQKEPRFIQSKKRYLLAFIIGTLIFIMGFSITYTISIAEFQRISNIQGKLSYQIFNDKILYSLFNKNICAESSFQKISQDLRFQGVIIDDLEKKLGKNDLEVLFRKKFYTLIELEHLEFVTETNKQCNDSINTLLFFYSNLENDLGKSEKTGRMLDALFSEYQNNLIIYSFDINLDSELIRELKQKFNIQSSPILIINQETKIINPENINDITKFLLKVDYNKEIIRLN